MEKSPDAFRTISEVGTDLELPQHVLRFWETRFTQIRPLKRSGGRRYYRPDDINLLRRVSDLKSIRQLLYGQGYTIKGVQRMLKERGAKVLVAQVLAGNMPQNSVNDQTAANDDVSVNGVDDTDMPAKDVGLSFEDIHRLKAALFEMNEGMRLLSDALGAQE